MNRVTKKTSMTAAWGLFVALIVFVPGRGKGEVAGESPFELIQFLTYQSPNRAGRPWLSSCGLLNTDRTAATKLANLGEVAIPHLEAALDSLEKVHDSKFRVNGGWLLLAYARITGRTGVRRLRRIASEQGPESFAYELGIDEALALSMGLTSVVSSFSENTDPVCRAPQPRDTFDRLVRSWEKNDRTNFEASLGPNGKAAFMLLIKGRTWAKMRNDFWHNPPKGMVAVGYRFEIPGPWSEPEEILDEGRYYFGVKQVTDGFDVQTRFQYPERRGLRNEACELRPQAGRGSGRPHEIPDR